MSESVGTYWRQEREFRNISLEEISQTTKIPVEYLESLEGDRFNKLPGLTFTKGYLRNYCDYLGLDADQEILRLEAFLEQFSKKNPVQIPKWRQKKSLLFGLVLLIILTSLMIWLKMVP